MPKKKRTDSKGPENSPSFEEAMERIEVIVEAMESDNLTLEQMLGNYEEGSRLLSQCQKNIDSAQKRIELISAARENGAVTLKEFQSEDEPARRVVTKPLTTSESTDQPPSHDEDEIRLF